MLTLHVEGKSLEDIKAKVDAILGSDAIVDVSGPATAAPKKGPGRPKKETAPWQEDRGVGTVDAPPPPAKTTAADTSATSVEPKAAPLAPTFDNMKSLLQKVAQTEKDANAGMLKVATLIKELTGKEKVKEIPEADYQKVMDAAQKLL